MNPVIGVFDSCSCVSTGCDDHSDQLSIVNLQQAKSSSVCVLDGTTGTNACTTLANSVGKVKIGCEKVDGTEPRIVSSFTSGKRIVRAPVWKLPEAYISDIAPVSSASSSAMEYCGLMFRLPDLLVLSAIESDFLRSVYERACSTFYYYIREHFSMYGTFNERRVSALRSELFAAASMDASTLLRSLYLDRINNFTVSSSGIPNGEVRRLTMEEITEFLRLFTVNVMIKVDDGLSFAWSSEISRFYTGNVSLSAISASSEISGKMSSQSVPNGDEVVAASSFDVPVARSLDHDGALSDGILSTFVSDVGSSCVPDISNEFVLPTNSAAMVNLENRFSSSESGAFVIDGVCSSSRELVDSEVGSSSYVPATVKECPADGGSFGYLRGLKKSLISRFSVVDNPSSLASLGSGAAKPFS